MTDLLIFGIGVYFGATGLLLVCWLILKWDERNS